MSRNARASRANWCYHVSNRGNGRAEVFHKDEDFAAFVRLFELANARLPMRLVGWCLMPNHFHLVLWPRRDGDLGRWMQWLLASHVRRYHRHYGGSGHVWQGRFKAFPIQRDEHFLTVLRYAERNPLASGPRRAHGGLVVVEPAPAGTRSGLRAAGPVAGIATGKLGVPRQSPAERSRVGSRSPQHCPRRAVRLGNLGEDHCPAIRLASQPAPPRPSAKVGKVECPLFSSGAIGDCLECP